MPRAARQNSGAPVSRRLTRLGLQTLFAQQFGALPIELIRAIAVAAAEDNVLRSARWVAQSLALVCRDFRDAVEPVLTRSLRFTDSNANLIDQHVDRFRTTRMLIIPLVDPGRFSCRTFTTSLLAASENFQPKALTFYCTLVYLPALRYIEPILTEPRCIRHVSHLRIHACSFFDLDWVLQHFLSTVEYLVVDPLMNFYLLPELQRDLVDKMKLTLASRRRLQRLLVRTFLVDGPDVEASLIHILEGFADPRIWLDDATPRSKRCDNIRAMEDEEQGTELWYTGRPVCPGT